MQLLTWRPGDPITYLFRYASNPEVIWEAHNAAFEQMVWKHIMEVRYGLPAIPIWRWSCSMAKAYYKGYPGSLDALATVLNLADQKDMEGSKLTIGLSRPITKKLWAAEFAQKGDTYRPIYDRRPATLRRVEDYCMQDCRVEYAVSQVVGELSPYERRVWELDQVVNQRGVKIDVPFVQAAIKVLAEAKQATLARFNELTGLAPKQVAELRKWLARNGAETEDLRAETVDKLLGGKLETDDEGVVSRGRELPANVHEVLALRRLLSATAIEKFPRMLACVGEGNRVRYSIQYHGAGTGRWAGRNIQPQNFPRASVPDRTPDEVVDAFLTGSAAAVEERLGMNPILAAGRALRHALIADEGRVYDSADFAGIEMRITLGLAGQHDKTEMFAKMDRGELVWSPYLDMAEKIYGKQPGEWNPNDKAASKEIKEQHLSEYTIGKHTVLGCGFGMGAKTFHDRYCAHMSEGFAKGVVDAYRQQWAWAVPGLWAAVEEAAGLAVATGARQYVRDTGIMYTLSTCGRWLMCVLPDGQTMWYAQPTYTGENWRGVPTWTYKAWKDGQWKTISAYGGLLTENLAQKLARGLLVSAMQRLEAHGWPVVLTVHDEILTEPVAGADHAAFEQIMASLDMPETADQTFWAQAMRVPVAVEGWRGRRFRK